jgi:hypothetical protein
VVGRPTGTGALGRRALLKSSTALSPEGGTPDVGLQPTDLVRGRPAGVPRGSNIAYSPPKTVEMTRKLVEEDHVFVVAGSNGMC